MLINFIHSFILLFNFKTCVFTPSFARCLRNFIVASPACRVRFGGIILRSSLLDGSPLMSRVGQKSSVKVEHRCSAAVDAAAKLVARVFAVPPRCRGSSAYALDPRSRDRRVTSVASLGIDKVTS